MGQDFQNAPDAGERVAVGVAAVRARLAELNASIGSLRAEADRLRASAAVRVTEVAVLDPEPDRAPFVAPMPATDLDERAPERSPLEGFDEDGDAFDRFFSGDVEPEPSQRWLLGEAAK